MGYQDGGGLARRARQLAPLVALAGAAAAGAAAAWRRRQRHRPAPADPDTSLAGPPRARASVATSGGEVPDGPAAPVEALVAALAPALEPSDDAGPPPAAPPEPTAGRPPLVRRGADGPVPDDDATADDPSATPRPIDTQVVMAVAGESAASGNGAEESDHHTAPRPPAPPPAPAGGSADPAATEPLPSRAERRFEPLPPPPHPTDSPAADAQPAAPPSPDPSEPPDPPQPTDDQASASVPVAPSPPATPPAAVPPAAAATGPTAGARHRRRGRISRHLVGLRRHRIRLIAGLVVVGLGVGASAGLAGGGDEPARAPSTSAPETTEPPPTTTTTTRPALEVAAAFVTAADRLSAAGTFRYEGSARATDVSFVRPMMWLSVESSVTGEVELATGRLHEIAIAAGGRASETITEGTVVWGRRAPLAASLADMPFALVPELSEPDRIAGRGLVMLPTWLAAATDPVELEPTDSGLAQYQATVPADVVGEVERGIEPEDLLAVVVLDGDGTPVRVELTTSSSDRLNLVLELSDVGESVTITPPAAPT